MEKYLGTHQGWHSASKLTTKEGTLEGTHQGSSLVNRHGPTLKSISQGCGILLISSSYIHGQTLQF
jgi:hypothetical protein